MHYAKYAPHVTHTPQAVAAIHSNDEPRYTLKQQAALACLITLCLWLAGLLPKVLAQETANTTNPPTVKMPLSVSSDTVSNTANAALVDIDDDDANDNDAQTNSRWPMRFTIPQGELTVYQPQLTDFQNNKMTGRAAVSIQSADNEEPVFGAIWLVSNVSTDRAARTVKIVDVKVERIRIPQVENLPQEALGNALTEAFLRDPMKLTLDQLIAMVERVKSDDLAVKDLSDAPPKIVFINNPAVLVQFDGEPRFVQSEQDNLLQAVNTPFFVVLDKQIKRYYLKGAGRWFIAREATGPYLAMNTAPAYVTQLAKDTGYIDPEEAMAQAQVDNTIDTPAIITATVPTELVWTLGGEELSPIEDTNLLYVTNTDSDIILDIDSQKIYVLLSGRWYRSSTRTGPWEYIAPDTLPADFARIPAASDKGSVLAHVAGTQMAKDALADNYVPQTASIDRTNYEQPPVQYDGDPRFEAVENLNINYAVNTPNAVLRIDGRYYVCYDAVWYQSNLATGPWELCTVVPSQIYQIPPTSPVYPVRYVRIYDVTPTVIYTGYLPGYVGSYAHNGVIVYGTGYHYRPWVGVGRVYYPRPYTWGFTPRYDPYNSYWGFSVGANINFGNGVSLWFGASNRYVPSYSNWFGYGGYRPVYIHPRYRNNHRFDRHDNYAHNNRFDRNDRNRNNQAYGSNYRESRDRFDRRPSPRRADLNLYERRRDVVGTHTPGRSVQTRQDRAQRIDQSQRPGLTSHDQRLDRNNDGRVSAQERAATNNNSNDNNRADRANRDDGNRRNDSTDRSGRSEQADRSDQRPGLTSHDQRLDRNKDGRVSSQERGVAQSQTRASTNNNTDANNANNADANTRRNNNGRNNVFADEDGNVYRKTIDGWERRDQNRWVQGQNPSPVNTNADRTRSRTITTNNGRGASADQNAADARTTTRTNWQSNRTNESRRTVTSTPDERNNQPDTSRRNVDRNSNSNNDSSRPTSSNADRSDTSRRTITTPNGVTSPATSRSQTSDPRSSVNRSRTTGRTNVSGDSSPRQSQRGATTNNTDSSLNADYRARVMGEQRQSIYNKSVTRPAAPQQDASSGRASSRSNTNSSTSEPSRARSESRSAQPAREAAPASSSKNSSNAERSSRSSQSSSGNSDSGRNGRGSKGKGGGANGE